MAQAKNQRAYHFPVFGEFLKPGPAKGAGYQSRALDCSVHVVFFDSMAAAADVPAQRVFWPHELSLWPQTSELLKTRIESVDSLAQILHRLHKINFGTSPEYEKAGS